MVEVLVALAGLTSGLQRTLAHLGRFLDEGLDSGRLTGTGADDTGSAAVTATRARLQQAHAAAGELSELLTGAAAAVTGTTATATGSVQG